MRNWQMAGASRRPPASPGCGWGNTLKSGQEGNTGRVPRTNSAKEKENSDHNM